MQSPQPDSGLPMINISNGRCVRKWMRTTVPLGEDLHSRFRTTSGNVKNGRSRGGESHINLNPMFRN